jgi:hypothetical protein
MKTALYTIAFALIALYTTSAAPPKDKLAETVKWYESKLTAIDGLVDQLQAKSSEADKQAMNAQAELAASKSELFNANDNLAKVKKDAEELTVYANEQFARANDNEKKLVAQKSQTEKYKREAHVKSTIIDITLGIIAVAVTVLVGMCSGQILGFVSKIYPPAAAFGMLIEIGLLVGTPVIVFGILKGVLAVVESKL